MKVGLMICDSGNAGTSGGGGGEDNTGKRAGLVAGRLVRSAESQAVGATLGEESGYQSHVVAKAAVVQVILDPGAYTVHATTESSICRQRLLVTWFA